MRKILVIVLVGFLGVTLVASGVLGYTAYKLNTDLTTSKKEVATLNNQITEVQQACASELVTFDDVGLKTAFEYPIAWNLIADFQMAPEIPPYPKYQITLNKDSNQLKFVKLIGGVGDLPEALYPAQHDYVVLSGDLIVRYALHGTNSWHYARKTPCADVVEIDPGAAAAEVCIEHFFPGFPNSEYATSASLTSSDAAAISEADQIVLSAH